MNIKFDRLPRDYRKLCERTAGKGRSPQNRRVRYAVDRWLAGQKHFPNNWTRQQERASSR